MNNPFGSSSGGGFGASRSMQQGFGGQNNQMQAPQQQGFGGQQQGFGGQQQGFGGFGGQQQGFGGFGGFGGQQMQNPYQQAPQQQGFGGYGGQQQGFGGYGGFGGQQQGFGGFGGFGGQQQYNPYQQMQQMQQYNPYQQMQQQYNPYQQMQQPQQQYGGFDPRAMSANPSGFQQWMEGARQQETQRPGSTMLSAPEMTTTHAMKPEQQVMPQFMQQVIRPQEYGQRQQNVSRRLEQMRGGYGRQNRMQPLQQYGAPEDMMSAAVMPQDYGQRQQSFGNLGGMLQGFGGPEGQFQRGLQQAQPGFYPAEAGSPVNRS